MTNVKENSLLSNESKPAILVRGVRKQYGKDVKVLEDLDMTVIKGTIYCLLGASGCGKTTLLRAILGCRKIQNGSILVLGKPPGLVSVKSIGYMPQDIALIGELTIKNSLQQQGWIFGMTDKEIDERIILCEKLLDLPPSNQLIKDLSGGQQRRVSLAVSLIPDPELLILDEPTVGLDPVLRQNFWDYIKNITTEENKTVVITTHYIEEARQADAIGMIRNGKMIAEGQPQTLMSQFNYSSLEDLFTSLSAQQEESVPNASNPDKHDRLSSTEELKILNQAAETKPLVQKICFTNRGHAKALLSKNIIRYLRHPGTYIMILLMPIVQMCSIFIAVGTIPSDWKIGIVNKELGEYKNCEDYLKGIKSTGGHVDEQGTCVFEGLGCKFTKLFQTVLQKQIFFESIEAALQAVKEKQIHQILLFPHNYSKAFTEVNNYYSNDTYSEDFIDVIFYKDDADNPLHSFIQKELYNSYLKFAEELASDCKWNKHSAKSPLIFDKPIYGKADLTYSDFLVPGWMTMAVLFLPMTIAIHTIIGEKNIGVWERSIISGVRPIEILIFHMITLSLISVIETAECFLIAYNIFGFECQGNIINVIMLLYSQSLVGIAMGIFLSVTSKDELQGTTAALGIVFTMFMINGMVWPIEGQPTYLQYLSYALPSTIPMESMNNIVFRGWGISNYKVYKGYLVVFGYFGLFTTVSILRMKIKIE